MNENEVDQGRSERSDDVRRLLDVYGLSEYLSLPAATIYTWVSLGRIPGVVRLGRALRFDRGEIDKWVEKKLREGT